MTSLPVPGSRDDGRRHGNAMWQTTLLRKAAKLGGGDKQQPGTVD